jgi:hypothetical protein
MLRKFIVFLLLIVSVIANADDSQIKDKNCCVDGGIVYGDKWAFLIGAPTGWSMTTESKLAVNVAFFQTKIQQNLKNPPAFMYVTVTQKSETAPTLEKFIANDESYFKAESNALKVTEVKQIKTKKNDVLIRKFENTGSQRNELIAYQDYEDWIFSLVLSAPSENDLSTNQNAFVEMLDSFQPMRKTD